MKKIKTVLILAVFSLLSISGITYEENIYHVESTKYYETNKDNFLTDVKLSGIDFNFDSNKTNYTLTVPFTKDTLEVKYTPSNEDALVNIIGGGKLYVGNNSLAIIVTSPTTGLVREYDFTIMRNEDNEVIENNSSSLKDAITKGSTSEITIEPKDKATNIDTNTLNSFKDTNKSLVFRWYKDGKFDSSITIKGKDVKDTSYINPNISYSIKDEALLEYVDGYDYLPISTKETNIPTGSIYKVAIDGVEDIYYLYYYEHDLLNKKPLRNMNGTLEFELKDGIDYALMVTKEHPKSSTVNMIDWIRPTIFITLIVLIFYLLTRYILITVVRKSPNIDINND